MTKVIGIFKTKRRFFCLTANPDVHRDRLVLMNANFYNTSADYADFRRLNLRFFDGIGNQLAVISGQLSVEGECFLWYDLVMGF